MDSVSSPPAAKRVQWDASVLPDRPQPNSKNSSSDTAATTAAVASSPSASLVCEEPWCNANKAIGLRSGETREEEPFLLVVRSQAFGWFQHKIPADSPPSIGRRYQNVDE